MERKRSFQFLSQMVLLTAILCMLAGIGKAEADGSWKYFARPQDVAYTERLPLPAVNFEDLLSDELHVKTADALRRWFIGYYSLREDWYNQFWDHTTGILTDPYIIRVEQNEWGETTVYCFSTITTYSLFKGDNEKLYFAQNLELISLFRVYFVMDDWWINNVECVEDMDEELYPGAGLGREGFPGLTDDLMAEIPDHYWGSESIAQKYLEINGIDATIETR